MIVTIFRSRLNPDAREEYEALLPEIVARAESMPGFLSRKAFVAEDGERLTLVAFEDEAAQRAWAHDTRHRAAQQRGREAFYSDYSVQVCTVVRESRFPR